MESLGSGEQRDGAYTEDESLINGAHVLGTQDEHSRHRGTHDGVQTDGLDNYTSAKGRNGVKDTVKPRWADSEYLNLSYQDLGTQFQRPEVVRVLREAKWSLVTLKLAANKLEKFPVVCMFVVLGL